MIDFLNWCIAHKEEVADVAWFCLMAFIVVTILKD